MLKMSDIVDTIIAIDDEMEFDYRDERFWLSACNAPDGKVLICGPHNHDIVDQDIDVILGTLIVGGRKLREMLHLID